VSATDILRSVLAPLLEFTVLAPMAMFWMLIVLGIWGGPIGIFLLVLTIPALFRFQSFIVESYASGRVPTAFDAEFFNWIGTMWTLLPLLLAMLLGLAGYYATAAWGEAGMWLVVVVGAGIVPASLAVLAITHSALQALNPLAMLRIYERAGARFLVAPLYLLVLVFLTVASGALPMWISIFMAVFAIFSLASLTGALIAPVRLVDDVYIPDPLEPDDRQVAGDLQKHRESVLAHAYGFISRDNREGGFRHIQSAIAEDPDPAAAWDWYLNMMFRWEHKVHALFFAQRYIHDALRHGEDKRALKATLRCVYEDETFRPIREDVAALVEAAERQGNREIAEVLKRA